MNKGTSLVLVTLLSLSPACSRVLPPLEAPTRRAPALDLDPPPPVEGQGRVAFDSQNVEGADVAIVTSRSTSSATAWSLSASVRVSGYGESTTPVCTAPCVANIPYGNYEVRFSKYLEPRSYSQVIDIQVGVPPTVVNANLGHFKFPSTAAQITGILLATLGGAAAITGGAFVAFEPAIGLPLLIGGGVGLGAGGVVLLLNPNELQKGQAAQYQPQDGVVYTRR